MDRLQNFILVDAQETRTIIDDGTSHKLAVEVLSLPTWSVIVCGGHAEMGLGLARVQRLEGRMETTSLVVRDPPDFTLRQRVRNSLPLFPGTHRG
jgi:hypothetical protein